MTADLTSPHLMRRDMIVCGIEPASYPIFNFECGFATFTSFVINGKHLLSSAVSLPPSRPNHRYIISLSITTSNMDIRLPASTSLSFLNLKEFHIPQESKYMHRNLAIAHFKGPVDLMPYCHRCPIANI